jgi:hypothetical protein
VSLHGKKRLGKKYRRRWHCHKILVHLKEFAPCCFVYFLRCLVFCNVNTCTDHIFIKWINIDGHVSNCLITFVMVLVFSNGMLNTPLIMHVRRLGVETKLDFLKRLVLWLGLFIWNFLHNKLMTLPTIITFMLWHP